jgi:hypothetical protein
MIPMGSGLESSRVVVLFVFQSACSLAAMALGENKIKGRKAHDQ